MNQLDLIMKTTTKAILAFGIFLTLQSCKSDRIGYYTIYDGLDIYSFTKEYSISPPNGMKSIYLIDTLSLSTENVILQSKKTDSYYIVPERLTEDKRFCENMILQNAECFIMYRVIQHLTYCLAHDYKFVEGYGKNTDTFQWEIERLDERHKKALKNDYIRSVSGFRCKNLTPWPETFLIFLVKGILYNNIIRDSNIGDNYKELDFPNPYGYYKVAVPVWLKEESK